jgi:hypothetical protein
LTCGDPRFIIIANVTPTAAHAGIVSRLRFGYLRSLRLPSYTNRLPGG